MSTCRGTLRTLGTPREVDGAKGLEVAPSPRRGEPAGSVLTDVLHDGGERIAALRARGAIA